MDYAPILSSGQPRAISRFVYVYLWEATQPLGICESVGPCASEFHQRATRPQAHIMAKMALSGAHTAGIYADLTLDGPEIGTLVVIVDRAKNLPNRKTMGKQDPYCAARLGKEAKKTETDKRGGQTPRW